MESKEGIKQEVQKIEEIIHFKPQVSIEEGLTRFVDWYK